MSSGNILDKVKELREITGVGFKDCKNAIDETKGDIQKSIDLLRTKGIAKANKRMDRVAAEGIICIHEKDNEFSIVEINSETDFVAKNNEFINFGEEVSALLLTNSGDLEKTLNSKMTSNKNVKDSLVDLMSKIGEKITIRRTSVIKKEKNINFSYIHTATKKNVGKLGVILSLETTKNDEALFNFGKSLSMHIAASSPLAIEKEGLNQEIINKENEIIIKELKNSGKDTKIVEKIASGKLNKFINENTLLNQDWIMEPKKKVKDVLKEIAGKDKITIKNFVRFKVGEGIEN